MNVAGYVFSSTAPRSTSGSWATPTPRPSPPGLACPTRANMNTAVLAAIVVVAVAFEAFCQINLYRAGEVRYLPKWAWAVTCLISIPVGGIVYLGLAWSSTTKG